MARIIYSGLIDNIRGSIAGTTFQNNKYGYTVKTKPNMTKPGTSYQSRSKAILSYVTRSWRELSQSQRDAYDTFAATYPQYAKHNPSAELSGYAIFIKYNVLRLLRNTTILSSITGTPPTPDTLTYIVDLLDPLLRIAIDSTTDSGTWDILFFISRPFTASQNFIGTAPKYVTYDVNADSITDITGDYLARYGLVPAVNDIVALDTVLIAQDCPYTLARTQDLYTVVTGT